MYSLDSNIVIGILRGKKEWSDKIEELSGEVVLTPVVLCELFKGAHLATKHEEALNTVKEFIDGFEVLDFTQDACDLYGKMYAELKKRGRPTQESDLMIGCISLAHGATLITHNHKDLSNIKGLKVISI